MSRKVDLTGQRFGMLTVLERSRDHTTPKGHPVTKYKCLCDCGRTTVVTHSRLTSEITKSCGCLAGRPGGKVRKKKKPGKPRAKRNTQGAKPETVDMPEHELHPDGIKNFVFAFARSCAKDILNAPPESAQRKQTEELLQTAYFERITGMDGKLLLARLQEEAEKRQQKKRRKTQNEKR